MARVGEWIMWAGPQSICRRNKQASPTPAKRVAVADHHVLRGVEGNIGSKVGPSARGSLLLLYITPPMNLQNS